MVRDFLRATMDLWNLNHDTIGRIAAIKVAREFRLNVDDLLPQGVRQLSGLYADVEVVERMNGKRHDVTVYDNDIYLSYIEEGL